MRVLLFDTDAGTRRLLADALASRGHEISACASAAEASAAGADGRHPLLLLDWSEPARAETLAAELRGASGGGGHLVVALLRNEAPGALVGVLGRGGADDFLATGGGPATIAGRLIALERRIVGRAAVALDRQLLHALMDHFPGNIYFKDLESRFLRVNHAFSAYVGRDEEALRGKTDFDIFAPEHARQALEDEREIIRSGKALLNVEERETWPDGRESWVSTSKAPLRDGAGRIVGTFGISVNITERRRAEAALRQSEERYALAVRGANDGIWDWDLGTGRVYYSTRWKAMLGFDEEAIGGSPEEWFGRVHPDDVTRVRGRVQAAIEGGEPHFEDEYRIRHHDGGYRWVLCRGFAVHGPDGAAVRVAGAQTDVTDRRAYDPLTSLPNRALFAERLESALLRVRRRHDHLFAVLFLDLDRFKLVNDSLGHLAGDQLLTVLAKRLVACVRPGDVVGRFGGDEFAILLDDVSGAEQATRIADRVLEAVAVPIDLGGHEAALSGSIGIALSASGYDKPEDVLRDADIAMYRAKSLGRARCELFDDAMRQRVMAQVALEHDLRRALERAELRLHYQPVVSLADGRLLGFEALLRWRHPERGLVLPEQFISVAEDAGSIVPIGEWVLREACRQMRDWHARFPAQPALSISVNCSPRQLGRSDFPRVVERVLAETGLDARRLVLEITESVLVDGAENAAAFARLKQIGLELHLDDFGTGYSSLSYLHRFPLDALKIDRSFVAQLDARAGTAGGPAFTRSIVALAQSCSMRVIAEGVETAEQAGTLRALSCDAAQGDCFSPAVEPAAAAALIEQPNGWTAVLAALARGH